MVKERLSLTEDDEEKHRCKGLEKSSSRKLGSLSVPSKTLQVKVFCNFFNCQSFKCSFVSDYCSPLQVYHRRRNKSEKVQPFIEGHNKPVQANYFTTNVVPSSFSVSNPNYATNYQLQVYHRRFKKNQKNNKCKTVEPSIQEGKNKKRKSSTFSTTEGNEDGGGYTTSLD